MSTHNICFHEEIRKKQQYSGLVTCISTSLISNNRLSGSENQVPVLILKSNNR